MTAIPETTKENWLEIVNVDLDKIKRSLTNPRKNFAPKRQEELQASMKAHGFTISTLLLRPLADTFYTVLVDDGGPQTGMTQLYRKSADRKPEIEATFPTAKEATAAMDAMKDCYELVAGERRWRAAKAVGIKTAPCIVRQLSDVEVLELQLVENVQRDDLTPIEEGEGYRQLLALRGADGKPIHSVKTLAARTGKSEDTISRHLRLTVLEGDARKAVEDGIWPARNAWLVARIPDAKLREKAVKAVLHPQYTEGPLSRRETEQLIAREFVRDLGSAPFDRSDASLIPVEMTDGERTAGGACDDCPFRSGNANPDGTATNAKNQCFHTQCYARKCEAGWLRWQEQETNPKKNRRALTQTECSRIYQYGDQLAWNCGLVDLKNHPDSTELRPGAESPGTWKNLVKGSNIEVLVARDKNGRTHELVKRELAIQAALNNGYKKEFKAGDTSDGGGDGNGNGGGYDIDEEYAAQDQRQDRNRKLNDAKNLALCEAIVKNAENAIEIPRIFWERLILDDDAYISEEILERRGMEPDAEWSTIKAAVSKLEYNQLVGMAVEIVGEQAINYRAWNADQPERIKERTDWAKAFGVDLAEFEERIESEFAAKLKAAKEVVPGGGLLWLDGCEELELHNLAGVPAAECFQWKDDICTRPAFAKAVFPKGMKIAATLFVAADEKGWYSGQQVEITGKNDTQVLVSRKDVRPVDNVYAALVDAAYAARSWTDKNGGTPKMVSTLSDLAAALIGKRDALEKEIKARSLVVDEECKGWLTNCPAGDINFKNALERANLATVEAAIKFLDDAGTGSKAAKKALQARANKLRKDAGEPEEQAPAAAENAEGDAEPSAEPDGFWQLILAGENSAQIMCPECTKEVEISLPCESNGDYGCDCGFSGLLPVGIYTPTPGNGTSTKEKVIAALREAGADGLGTAELAEKVGVKSSTLNVWLYTTGTKVKEIKKVKAGRWALKEAK